MKMLKGDVSSILSSGASEKEQHDLCIGRDSEVSDVKNEDDDAEVPTYLWNDRMTRSWRSLEDPDDTIN
jgi:hypothetical protein